MKKLLPLLLVLCLFLSLMPVSADMLDYVEPPKTQSPFIILVDGNGNELYSVSPDERAYPASTTKILTVLLAIEAAERGEVSLDDTVTAERGFLYNMSDDASNAGIVTGEQMSLRDLLYCAMLPSANEACNVIAMYVAGSVDAFVELMNERLAELGCEGSHFANANGMSLSDHYTTARDMSRIALEAMKHEAFLEICGCAEYTVPATNASPERHLRNSNALINSKSIYGSGYVYDGAYGVKTGRTDMAGHCLVAAAKRDGFDLLCVVLGAKGNYSEGWFNNFADAITVFDWAFDSFTVRGLLDAGTVCGSIPVVLGLGADSVDVVAKKDIVARVAASFGEENYVTEVEIDPESLDAPVKKGTLVGHLKLYDEFGTLYGETGLVTARDIEFDEETYRQLQIAQFLDAYGLYIAVGLALLVILIVTVTILLCRKIKKKKAKDGDKK